MFRKVLVANRSEIAVRVIRACREMGVASVAVYSDADQDALHVRMADEAVRLGPPPSRESYLLQDKILEVAEQTGAEAIHPGYGFLSENATFVRACERAGVKFIGPSSKAMEAMGDKVSAKRSAVKAGVPVSPGSDGPVDDPARARKLAEDIGYPVIVKAAHGGGGIGMRVVRDEKEIAGAIEGAMRQAESAFGNPEVFVEKFIENPRHIEFQILGDEHGNVVHLGERECSIQRRNQKLLEEAPSTILGTEERADIGGRAVKLAKLIGYTNAGTMEFLWKDGLFYFMEMNTRLQVEHPVTELVTGVDLVKLQLRIASGEKLPFTQQDVKLRGHAMELRLNAEDAYRSFAPSPGRVHELRWPQGPGIRVDAGIYAGFAVPGFYDSLVAKLIAYDSDRAGAVARLERALGETELEGLTTNIPFHRKLLAHDAFRAGRLHTGFIQEHGLLEEMVQERDRERAERRVMAAAVVAALERSGGGGLRGYAHRLNRAAAAAPGTVAAGPVPTPSAWALAGRRERLRRGG